MTKYFDDKGNEYEAVFGIPTTHILIKPVEAKVDKKYGHWSVRSLNDSVIEVEYNYPLTGKNKYWEIPSDSMRIATQEVIRALLTYLDTSDPSNDWNELARLADKARKITQGGGNPIDTLEPNSELSENEQ